MKEDLVLKKNFPPPLLLQVCKETSFVNKKGFDGHMATCLFLSSEPFSCCLASTCCWSWKPMMHRSMEKITSWRHSLTASRWMNKVGHSRILAFVGFFIKFKKKAPSILIQKYTTVLAWKSGVVKKYLFYLTSNVVSCSWFLDGWKLTSCCEKRLILM